MSREHTEVYRPAEDSLLLEKYVQRLVAGEVLDMGTGSGIQAVSAALKPEVSRVVAVDIDSVALEVAQQRARLVNVDKKIEFIQSNLYDKVTGKYDWILFNPPYLPSEVGLNDKTWDGGPTGGEIIIRFLKSSLEYLKPGGSILMIYSTETQIDFNKAGYNFDLLEKIQLFFETIHCVRLNPF